MNSRRKFIKNLTAVGATVPLVANIEAKPKKNKGPVILCSRGEVWGEKVLKPGLNIIIFSEPTKINSLNFIG